MRVSYAINVIAPDTLHARSTPHGASGRLGGVVIADRFEEALAARAKLYPQFRGFALAPKMPESLSG
ncbi:MAG: hypothetical protein QNI87_06405 [Erythrobacter sp.]|uniref:hypothetical protein n=1 Tax=Erythrobacter sp. TaxID=1042 RepID=UPI002615F7D3|nr:hypothetical protein [Erythrobacter sp.]MDJ0978148.1 hypothetical protein [Erythrobacter sp.]